MRQPNGIAFDPQGNIVVVNIGTEDVHHVLEGWQGVQTEKAAQSGNDGLVIMKDGTKYVSSVVNGGVSRIRPGRDRRADRAEHPEPRVDVLRLRREPARNSDERQQRAGVHSNQVGGSASRKGGQLRRSGLRPEPAGLFSPAGAAYSQAGHQ